MNVRSRLVEALTWYSSTSQGMNEYLSLMTRIQKSPYHNNDDHLVRSLENGYIVAWIDSQIGHIAAWLRFAYSPDLSLVLRDQMAAYFKFREYHLTTPKKHTKQLGLCKIACEEVRAQVCGDKRAMPNIEYSKAMRMRTNDFERHWIPEKTRISYIIKAHDAESVHIAAMMIHALSGRGESPTKLLNKTLDSPHSSVV